MFRIGSIFIPVSDVEQSLNWYTTYFHAQEIGRWEGGIEFVCQMAQLKSD